MTDAPSCKDCLHMIRSFGRGDHGTDNQGRARERCYSPQLRKMRLAGTIVVFERDATPEEGREPGTEIQKCGPAGLNFQKRVAV